MHIKITSFDKIIDNSRETHPGKVGRDCNRGSGNLQRRLELWNKADLDTPCWLCNISIDLHLCEKIQEKKER